MSINDIKFDIDSEKTTEFAHFLKNKSDELDRLYQDVLKLCDDIEKNYISEDSSVYLDRFRNNVNILQNENKNLRKGGITLDSATALYTQQEDKWAKEMAQIDLDKEVNG